MDFGFVFGLGGILCCVVWIVGDDFIIILVYLLMWIVRLMFDFFWLFLEKILIKFDFLKVFFFLLWMVFDCVELKLEFLYIDLLEILKFFFFVFIFELDDWFFEIIMCGMGFFLFFVEL